ncbi:MAG TPA: hypothetical protein PKD85_22495, partial [Saprospiraceae bacterium]|nr:hypothetical protein [Saprospiraceae bacterium]
KDKAQSIQRDKIREARMNGESDVTVERSDDQITIKPVEVNPDIYQERNLIRLIITGGDKPIEDLKDITVAEYLLPILRDYLDYFEDPVSKKIVEFGLSQIDRNKKIEPKDFIYNEDQDISRIAVDYTMSKYEYAKWEERGVYLQTQPMPEKNFKKDTYQSILRFKLHKVRKDIKEMESLIKQEGISDEQKLLDIQVLQALLKERNDIAKELTQIIY